MASKYQKLTAYLGEVESEGETLTFGQIEEIIGSPLPASARTHQAWWANQPRGQALAWLRAGFKSGFLALDEERLTFVRDADDVDGDDDGMTSLGSSIEALSLTEAKERLAATFGVDPSQIEITIRA